MSDPRDGAKSIEPLMEAVFSDAVSAAMSKHRIRQLNDAFRQTFIGGRVVVTPGVRSFNTTFSAT